MKKYIVVYIFLHFSLKYRPIKTTLDLWQMPINKVATCLLSKPLTIMTNWLGQYDMTDIGYIIILAFVNRMKIET